MKLQVATISVQFKKEQFKKQFENNLTVLLRERGLCKIICTSWNMAYNGMLIVCSVSKVNYNLIFKSKWKIFWEADLRDLILWYYWK